MGEEKKRAREDLWEKGKDWRISGKRERNGTSTVSCLIVAL